MYLISSAPLVCVIMHPIHPSGVRPGLPMVIVHNYSPDRCEGGNISHWISGGMHYATLLTPVCTPFASSPVTPFLDERAKVGRGRWRQRSASHRDGGLSGSKPPCGTAPELLPHCLKTHRQHPRQHLAIHPVATSLCTSKLRNQYSTLRRIIKPREKYTMALSAVAKSVAFVFAVHQSTHEPGS